LKGAPPELTIRSSFFAEKRLALSLGQITIGRSETSDIFLPDESLSRRHAEIREQLGVYHLVDLGSMNGTYVNGNRVMSEQRLHDGDVIQVGESTIAFSDARAPRPSGEDLAKFGARSFSLGELAARSTRRAMDVVDLQSENRVLGIVSRAAAALLVHRPLPDLFERIHDLLFEAIPAGRGAIMLLEGDPPQPRMMAARSREGEPITDVSSAIARRVVDERVALLLPDVTDDAGLVERQSIRSLGIRSAMCVPLWCTSASEEPHKVIGLVYLDTRERSKFDEGDLELLTVLANIAAAKIETTRLIEDSVARRRLEDEMRVAAEIQGRLLPRTAPRIQGYDLVGFTRPCHTVGGDYYDFAVDEGKVLIALGDVSGKGTGAAMLMIALRAAVRAHWAEPDLGLAMARVNHTFLGSVPDDKYATLFVGRLDPRTGRLTYVNAGHDRPLLVRPSGRIDTLGEGGTVVGMFEDPTWTEGVAEVGPGDTLLIFSDGVSDTWPTEEAVARRLGQITMAEGACAASRLEAAILQDVEAEGGSRPADDRTLMVLKRLA